MRRSPKSTLKVLLNCIQIKLYAYIIVYLPVYYRHWGITWKSVAINFVISHTKKKLKRILHRKNKSLLLIKEL